MSIWDIKKKKKKLERKNWKTPKNYFMIFFIKTENSLKNFELYYENHQTNSEFNFFIKLFKLEKSKTIFKLRNK